MTKCIIKRVTYSTCLRTDGSGRPFISDGGHLIWLVSAVGEDKGVEENVLGETLQEPGDDWIGKEAWSVFRADFMDEIELENGWKKDEFYGSEMMIIVPSLITQSGDLKKIIDAVRPYKRLSIR